MLLYLSNNEVVKDVLWIYAHILEGVGETANYVMKQIEVERIIHFVNGEDYLLKIAAVRVIGNICAWEDKQVEKVIEHGGMTALKKIILKGGEALLVREACWALSNIAVGPSKHVQMLIDQGIISKLADIAKIATDYSIKREAGWAILNACRCKDISILNQLIEQGALHTLNELLNTNDTTLSFLILDVLKGILLTGTEGKKFYNLLESIGFVHKLEQLQLTTNIALFKRVEEFLNHFVYSDHDEVMEANNET